MAESNFIHNIIDKDLETQKYGDKVHTRFPPEPNGYLHIGHAKSICLNFSTAEKYGGQCNLRYDDTNPVKEDVEYVDSIEEDVKWLGFQWDNRLWASDYFDEMYDCALDLIKKGKAYVCDLSADEIRAYRGTLKEPGKESPSRSRSVEENLKLFEEMREGKYADGEKVLRAKIDMASPNMNMRDPVIYRIAHMQPSQYWRQMVHLSDVRLRSSYRGCYRGDHSFYLHAGIRRSQTALRLGALETLGRWEAPPQQIEFARLNLTNTVMSKRYLKAMVDDGTVDGWDDPRMPTIAGIRRRGYTPEAVRDFCERIGVSKANSTVDVGLLEHCVREDLKQKVASRNVVENPVKVIITNYPEEQTEEMELENNREVPEMGNRTVPFSRELYVDGDDFMEVPIKKYFRLFPGNEVRFKGRILHHLQ